MASKDNDYDVVIVGSGPAGAATAKALSGHGLKIAIVEKAQLPRYKMCSGCLSPTSVRFVAENFGPIPEHILSEPSETIGARVHTTIGGKVVEFPFSLTDKGPDLPEIGMSIKRAEFDQWLCESGDAEIIDGCRFKKIRTRDSNIEIIVEKKSGDTLVSARYLVGADGPLSKVRSAISPEFMKGLRMIPNYEEWYVGEADLESKWLNVFLDGALTSYFASVFHKDNKVIVANGAKQTDSVKDYFKALVDNLKRNHGLIIKETLASHGCVLTDMSARGNCHFGDGNILLAGEAGGFSRAFGEGISSAFVTGKAAGEAVLSSMDSGGPAFQYYKDKADEEAALCKEQNRIITEIFGLNPFTR